MKKTAVILIACLSLLACSNPNITEFETWAEASHRELMELERGTLGNCFRTVEFHSNMMLECKGIDKSPYLELRARMDTMLLLKNQIQTRRGRMYQKHQELIRNKRTNNEVIEEAKKQVGFFFEETAKDTLAFDIHYQRYEFLLDSNKIQRITHAEYADSLLTRMIRWEDTLEVQGGLIAERLRALNGLGMKINSPIYIDYYQPISQMQKMHKDFQSKLISTENAHSRYVAARPNEGFYNGPYLAYHPEVDECEAIFFDMDSIQSAFRAMEELAILMIRR